MIFSGQLWFEVGNTTVLLLTSKISSIFSISNIFFHTWSQSIVHFLYPGIWNQCFSTFFCYFQTEIFSAYFDWSFEWSIWLILTRYWYKWKMYRKAEKILSWFDIKFIKIDAVDYKFCSETTSKNFPNVWKFTKNRFFMVKNNLAITLLIYKKFVETPIFGLLPSCRLKNDKITPSKFYFKNHHKIFWNLEIESI